MKTRIDEMEHATARYNAKTQENNGWQPIKTAPKDGTLIVACWLLPELCDWPHTGAWQAYVVS